MLVCSLNSWKKIYWLLTQIFQKFPPPVTLHNTFFSHITKRSPLWCVAWRSPKCRQAVHTSFAHCHIFQHSQCSPLTQIPFALILTYLHLHTTINIHILITLMSIFNQQNSPSRSTMFSNSNSSWTLNSQFHYTSCINPPIINFTINNPSN